MTKPEERVTKNAHPKTQTGSQEQDKRSNANSEVSGLFEFFTCTVNLNNLAKLKKI